MPVIQPCVRVFCILASKREFLSNIPAFPALTEHWANSHLVTRKKAHEHFILKRVNSSTSSSTWGDLEIFSLKTYTWRSTSLAPTFIMFTWSSNHCFKQFFIFKKKCVWFCLEIKICKKVDLQEQGYSSGWLLSTLAAEKLALKAAYKKKDVQTS